MEWLRARTEAASCQYASRSTALDVPSATPYRYGVPLLVMAALLHWMLSQSIFLARLQAFESDRTPDSYYDVSTCGYSLCATVTTISFGAFILLIGLINGFHRYKPEMPLAGSCSAAISAACQPMETEKDPSMKALQWGVAETEREERGIGYCRFSS